MSARTSQGLTMTQKRQDTKLEAEGGDFLVLEQIGAKVWAIGSIRGVQRVLADFPLSLGRRLLL